MRNCISHKNKLSSNIKPQKWLNHLKHLLNRDTNLANEFNVHGNNENNIQDVLYDACDENEPDILNHDINENELRMVITNLSRGKSPGIDGIVYEL